MKDSFKKTSLRTLVLLTSIFCSIVACLLLYFFAREVDKVYSDLIKRDVKATEAIQSIFTQRINNTTNIIKIETNTNTDTIDAYINIWYNQAIKIGNTFDSLKLMIPKDSNYLIQELNYVIAKRKIHISHTKIILDLKKKNLKVNILDSIKEDLKEYNNSLSDFLTTYNNFLLERSKKLTKQTMITSSLYLLILPIPLIILILIFIYTLVVTLRDFNKNEK